MATHDIDFWYKKIKSFVPGCVYKDGSPVDDAVFYGLAAVYQKLECTLDEHIAETYICDSEGVYTNEHGFERNLKRFPLETDASFQQRIKNIINSSNCPEVKRIVDALLEVGEAQILEDEVGMTFYNRESFYNRGFLLYTSVLNTFSILVDKQIHEPYAFYGREYFQTREDFYGTNESSLELFQRIVETVNAIKACGVRYRLIERVG